MSNWFKNLFFRRNKGEDDNGGYWRTCAEIHGGSGEAAGAGARPLDPALAASTFDISGQNPGEGACLAPGASFTVLFGGSGTQWFSLVDPNEDKEPLENVGVRVGEILAWRCWELIPRAGLLQSITQSTMWVPGEPMTGKPTDYGCEGINAYKTASGAMTAYGIGDDDEYIVTGRVLLWGEIVEHEHGYRAEFGLPVSLDFIVPDTRRGAEWLRRLKAKYDRPDLLSTHGSAVHGHRDAN